MMTGMTTIELPAISLSKRTPAWSVKANKPKGSVLFSTDPTTRIDHMKLFQQVRERFLVCIQEES